MAELVEPMDRAMRNTRVLVRRVAVANYHRQPVPGSYALLLRDLADTTDEMAAALEREEIGGGEGGGVGDGEGRHDDDGDAEGMKKMQQPEDEKAREREVRMKKRIADVIM